MHATEATALLVVLGTVAVAAPLSGPAATSRTIAWVRSIRWPVAVYCCSRRALLLVAGLGVIIWARALPGRRYALFLGAEAAIFLLASGLTLAGVMLP